jgi:hypothetical protein
MNEQDIQKLIEAMQEVFPTAEMVKNGFDEAQADRTVIKKTLAEMRGDAIQLEEKVDAISGVLGNIPTKIDLEHLLEKTYNLQKLVKEHDKMKRFLKEQFNVEVEA